MVKRDLDMDEHDSDRRNRGRLYLLGGLATVLLLIMLLTPGLYQLLPSGDGGGRLDIRYRVVEIDLTDHFDVQYGRKVYEPIHIFLVWNNPLIMFVEYHGFAFSTGFDMVKFYLYSVNSMRILVEGYVNLLTGVVELNDHIVYVAPDYDDPWSEYLVIYHPHSDEVRISGLLPPNKRFAFYPYLDGYILWNLDDELPVVGVFPRDGEVVTMLIEQPLEIGMYIQSPQGPIRVWGEVEGNTSYVWLGSDELVFEGYNRIYFNVDGAYAWFHITNESFTISRDSLALVYSGVSGSYKILNFTRGFPTFWYGGEGRYLITLHLIETTEAEGEVFSDEVGVEAYIYEIESDQLIPMLKISGSTASLVGFHEAVYFDGRTMVFLMSSINDVSFIAVDLDGREHGIRIDDAGQVKALKVGDKIYIATTVEYGEPIFKFIEAYPVYI